MFFKKKYKSMIDQFECIIDKWITKRDSYRGLAKMGILYAKSKTACISLSYRGLAKMGILYEEQEHKDWLDETRL